MKFNKGDKVKVKVTGKEGKIKKIYFGTVREYLIDSNTFVGWFREDDLERIEDTFSVGDKVILRKYIVDGRDKSASNSQHLNREYIIIRLFDADTYKWVIRSTDWEKKEINVNEEEIEKVVVEYKTIEQKVGEAIGEASMCWLDTPKGVFNSSRAKRITEALLEEILKELKTEPLTVKEPACPCKKIVINFTPPPPAIANTTTCGSPCRCCGGVIGHCCCT